MAAITQAAGKPCPKIWIGPLVPGSPPNSLILMVENTVPSRRLWIERSLVPKKMVVTASITCDNPFFGLSQVIEAVTTIFFGTSERSIQSRLLGTVFSTIRIKLFGGEPGTSGPIQI